MAKVIAQAEEMRLLEERSSLLSEFDSFDTWDYSRRRERLLKGRDGSPDACLIRAYMKKTKGLHVRRTLAQSHYSMLSSTEERDMDQILLKHSKDKTLHKHGKGTAKIVMVDQLWLWIFDGLDFPSSLESHSLTLFSNIDILITSFPQTWGRIEGQGKDHDLLESLIDHIRGPRDDSFRSVFDLAITIIKRCSTIFTSDPKLLFPSPSLMEIFQEALGAVVRIVISTSTTNELTNCHIVSRGDKVCQDIQRKAKQSFDTLR
jgi:hypothetical protein